MALQSNWPLIDNAPPANGTTLAVSGLAAATDLTAISGMPVAATSAVLIQAVSAGAFVFTMVGGGTVTINMRANTDLFLRMAAVSLADPVVADGSVTVFYDANSKKNP